MCAVFARRVLASREQILDTADMATSGASEMKKSCDHCKRYLDHLDERTQSMSCFLRRMTASPNHIMIVPNKFLKHFAGKLSQTIKLESPNGSVYNVEVTKCYNKMVLREGWKEFVGAHHIEENDLLLFQHIENSVFRVLIFDSDGCEKIICCDCNKSVPSVGEKRVDYVDISSSSQFDTIGSSGKLSSRHGETLKMTVTSSSSGGSGEDIPSENESFESDDLQTPGADYIVSHRTYLSQEQKERVNLLIKEIQPKTTIYIAVMRKCHVHPLTPFVDIIKEYAFAYFPHGNANITLQTPGKSKKWHPEFNPTKGSVYRLQGQWLDFVRDNHVQEGDICAFLPVKLGIRFTFTVYLIRTAATDSRNETGFQRAGPCPGGSSPKMASEVHIKEPTDGEHVLLENDMNENLCESLEIEDSGSPSHPLYFLPSYNSGLSESQKKIVEERVRAIKSEVPIYVAIMRRSHLGMLSHTPKLELGSRFATAVNLPAGGQTVVLWCGRNIWKTNMVTSGQRHYLSRGWRKFVRDNDLDLGDICLFELKRNEGELTMMVHIIPRKELSSQHGETLKMTGTSSCGGSGDIPSESECFESDDLQAPGAAYIVSNRSYLSQEQNERVTLLIQEIRPKTVVYIAVMRKSHVHPPAPSVDITKEYAFAYFPHGNANVTLQRPGKSKKWHPKFNTTKGRLQGQWLDFVRDNGVQEGDICAFLPAPAKIGRRFTFTVYLLQAAASHSRSETGFQRVGPCTGGGSSPNMSSEVHIKEPMDGDHVSSKRDMNGILHESLERTDSGSSSHPLYFLTCSSGLSNSQKKIVEERVQAIKSEVPIYVAIMKQISLGMSRTPKQELGSRYAAAVNLPREQSVVLWCGGNMWKTNLVTFGERRYLCGGWRKFVRDNGLDLGDICLFELNRNERKLTMMVHIIPRNELLFVV